MYQIDNINKEIEIVKKRKKMELLELNSIPEIKNLLVGLSSRFELTEAKVSRLEARSVEIM